MLNTTTSSPLRFSFAIKTEQLFSIVFAIDRNCNRSVCFSFAFGVLFTWVMFVHSEFRLSDVTFSVVYQYSRIDKAVSAQFEHSASGESLQAELHDKKFTGK